MTTPSLDLADYTHEKLIARGYTRHTFPEYPGWVIKGEDPMLSEEHVVAAG